MNPAMAKRIIQAARREEEAWLKLVQDRFHTEEDEIAVAMEYVEASVALAVEIDNYRTMEAMRGTSGRIGTEVRKR